LIVGNIVLLETTQLYYTIVAQRRNAAMNAVPIDDMARVLGALGWPLTARLSSQKASACFDRYCPGETYEVNVGGLGDETIERIAEKSWISLYTKQKMVREWCAVTGVIRMRWVAS